MIRILLISYLFILLNGCSGISMLSGKGATDYRPEFLSQVNKVKEQHGRGNFDQALNFLDQVEAISPVEKATTSNLRGIIFFSQSKYTQAKNEFEKALSNSDGDSDLKARTQLNLSSTLYKLNSFGSAFNVSEDIEIRDLEKSDQKKLYKLRYVLSEELKKEPEAISALIGYLSDVEDFSLLQDDFHFRQLLEVFSNRTVTEQMDTLEKNSDPKTMAVGYLAYMTAKNLYFSGKRDEAKNLFSWTKNKFSEYEEVTKHADRFLMRIGNYSKMNPNIIGVALPLTGRHAGFGQRALLGINEALRLKNKNILLKVKDTKGSESVGKLRIKELVEEHQASAIIGGLLPDEATEEYLEARKYGVLFLSLSQVLLPREEKDHLLIEIPGSIESIVKEVFSNASLSHFGKRAAVMFPEDLKGRTFIDEFWKASKQNGVSLTGVESYVRGLNDYRTPVKKLIGLAYPKERKEETDFLKKVYAAEGGNIKRTQVLSPVIDFDWIFVLAAPREARQLLPSFGYFDAFGLKFIGGESWRSPSIQRESAKLAGLHFVSEETEKIPAKFINAFQRRYKKRPKVIEFRSFDALNIALDFIFNKSENAEVSRRDQLEDIIRSKKVIKSLTGTWELTEGLWIKNLHLFKFNSGKIQKLL